MPVSPFDDPVRGAAIGALQEGQAPPPAPQAVPPQGAGAPGGNRLAQLFEEAVAILTDENQQPDQQDINFQTLLQFVQFIEQMGQSLVGPEGAPGAQPPVGGPAGGIPPAGVPPVGPPPGQAI